MKDSKKKVRKSNSLIFLLLICVSTCFLGIGFAQINTTLNITGNISTLPQANLFITEVNYISDIGADLNNSNILNTYQTILGSNIALSQTLANSKLTYEIKIYNSTTSDYAFKGPVYMLGENTYDNENILFSLEGITEGDIIKSKDFITFRINFYYKNNTIPADNQLSSVINFEFEPYVELASAGTLNINSSNGIFGGTISKGNVERIYFVDHENVPTGATMWDASVEGNYAITAWAVDDDQNGLQEVYIGANNGKISLPANLSSLFYYYGALKSVDFNNVDASNVTNMYQMFYYCNVLNEVNFSNFDTTNVTNMSYMFIYCSALTEIDLSSFETSNTTSMSYMFFGTKPEIIKLNNATFANLTSSYGMLPNITTPLIVVVKDSEEKAWITRTQTAIGENTEFLTVEEYQNRYPNN